MATTVPKVPDEERREAPDVVDKKAQILMDHIRESKHFIVFTGAGISTSAGIPDFRGPEGAWTLRAQGRQRTGKTTSTLQAIPTPTHMALVELQNRGILKYVVSQNCDGLHRRSGILPEHISELHGNNNKEYCKDCGKEYIRDFRAVATYEKTVHDHRTGRKCTRCGGPLLDTIINFGDPLPAGGALRQARDHARRADLCLVLGSSCTVTPTNEIPTTVGRRNKMRKTRKSKVVGEEEEDEDDGGSDEKSKKEKKNNKGTLVICNLQDTPIDNLSSLRIYSTTDDLMIRVMRKLDLPIPVFILHRRLMVKGTEIGGGGGGGDSQGVTKTQVTVCGVDVDGTPLSFLQSVRCLNNRRLVRTEPFTIDFRGGIEPGTQVRLELEFMGHYGEPNLEVLYEYAGEDDKEQVYNLEYNPANGEWHVGL